MVAPSGSRFTNNKVTLVSRITHRQTSHLLSTIPRRYNPTLKIAAGRNY